MPAPSEFKNAREVGEYLTANGWKVTPRTVHSHMKKGLLLAGAGGLYGFKAVNKYARLYLERKDTRMRVNAGQLADARAVQEVRKLKAQTELAEFDLDIKKGRFISREDSELQTAQAPTLISTSAGPGRGVSTVITRISCGPINTMAFIFAGIFIPNLLAD